MLDIRFLYIGVLIAAPACAGDALILRVTHQDAVTLFADKAVLQPRVEVKMLNGERRRGKLIDASVTGFSLSKGPMTPLCDTEWIKVIGGKTSRSRIGRGITSGILAGLFATGLIIAAEPNMSGSLAYTLLIGLPTAGGMLGARVAENGQDIFYALRPGGPGSPCSPEQRSRPYAAPPSLGSVTLPLPPIRLWQP